MAKTAIEGATRGNLFYVYPEDINIPGIDYECGPGDILYNPRNLMDVSEELVTSIIAIGILEPIGVKKDADGLLHVVYGNQRVRAAREANNRLTEAGQERIKVPCLPPIRGNTEDEIGEMKIAENEIRKESSPLVKAEEAALQLRRKNGNIKEAARAFGVTEQYFKELLTLREASPEVKEAVQNGELSAGAAAEVAKLSPAKQKERLRTVIKEGGTIGAAKHNVKKATGKAAEGKPSTALLKELVELRSAGDVLGAKKTGILADDGFWTALAWVTGTLKTEKVKGLKELVDHVSAN